MSTVATPCQVPEDAGRGMPIAGLLALALLGFIAILTETLPAGLLPQIGQSLSAGDALTGQLVTAYALGSVVAAIPGAVLTRSWRRRSVLLTAVGGFLVFNSVTALSTDFSLSLFARFMAGASAGMTWSLVPIYARLMAPAGSEGRAMAIALVGTPFALALGVPVGTWVGTLVGWRIPFFGMSAVAFVLVAWIVASVPDFPGVMSANAKSVSEVLMIPGILPILAVVLSWMLGHNILYTYISPFLRSISMEGETALVLLGFGAGAIGGIWLTGALVDRYLRLLVLASLVFFAVTSALLPVAGYVPELAYFLAIVWGATFGGAATLLQTASADAAGPNADIAQSMIVTVWNSAIAGGGVGGGILLGLFGPQSFAPAVLVLSLIACLVAARAKRHGFPAGRD